jgi:hypothetical protein
MNLSVADRSGWGYGGRGSLRTLRVASGLKIRKNIGLRRSLTDGRVVTRGIVLPVWPGMC